jgi:beta-xylosidase
MNHSLILITLLLLAPLAVLHAVEPAAKPAWGDQGDGSYRNPILWADYNNPCVFKACDTFYLTCASHHFMGMPLLASKDLVNWTHAGRIYSHLGGVHADFTFPGKACSAGSQDGEVGFFRGTYYMFNWSTKYRGFVSKANAPEGPWSEPVSLSEKIVGDFEDPCPFWDDDGKGYLFLLGNPGALRIYRLNDTFDTIVDQGTVLIDDIPPKGPQVFKRNGFYYISVASTGKNKDKAQYVYRSKSLYGPYESRKLFHAGKADINAAQGSLVEVSGDRWAFLHHDYNLFATYGRRLYLEPAGWTVDGWPWIGVDSDGDGIGEPVGLTEPYAKPALPVQPINAADPSDEFDTTTLGGQWAWNHDPDDSRWSLTARPGHLRLTARHLNTQGGVSQFGRTKVNYREDHLLFAYNTLVQRLYGAESDIVTKLDTTNMIDGQRAGLCTMIDDYTWIGVAKEGGVKRIRFAKGTATAGPGAFTDGPELKHEVIWLKLEHRHYKGTMFYSLDGEHFEPLGDRDYAYRTAWYEGSKVGLFSYNVSSAAEGGHADFDFFHQQHDGPRTTRKE